MEDIPETDPPISINEGVEHPMLEVHPPTTAIHGWKDFFIHIATITLGLLIAIALEQTVEYFHNLNQLNDARREIAAELNENRRIANINESLFQKAQSELDNDLKVLRAGGQNFAGLDYNWDFWRTRDDAWQAIKQSGGLSLMPHEELRDYGFDYAVFSDFMTALNASTTEMDIAGAIARQSSNGSFSQRDVDDLVAATRDAQGKLAYAYKILQFEKAGLNMPHKEFPQRN